MSETGGITVSQLNLMIAEAIRKDPRIRSVTVHGEVSGFRHHLASGHWYFTLKDEEAAVSCVMFRQNTFNARMKPKDGDSILVSGYVDVYPRSGTVQLYVTGLRPAGTGDLFARFEELKKRLSAEGLFDPARKRVLPMVPRKVAVVTSGSGAAWHDILNVSGMRCPAVPIVLVPAAVQGDKAATEIAAAIQAANDETDADVLIVARGGGSAEDLLCFNEEIVARAVAASRIPVVSGVGHEIDTTICDLAADVRASTPSNAAEIVFPDRKELYGRIRMLSAGLRRAGENEWIRASAKVQEWILRMTASSPEKRIAMLSAGSALRKTELNHAMRIRLDSAASKRSETEKEMHAAIAKCTDLKRIQLMRLSEKLEAISPLKVLERGYTMVTDRKGRILTETRQATEAVSIRIRFADGSVEADVRKDKV